MLSMPHTSVTDDAPKEHNIIRLASFCGERDAWYRISISDKTCDCPNFDTKKGCEHLSAIGIHRLKPFIPKTHPTFGQALSALIKSLRIRRIEEAVYWMVYLDTFPDPHYRFRVARRLFVASAEDGLSIPVMEQSASTFREICRRDTDLLYLVAEAARVCKTLNWWHPDSGGVDYIYQSLVSGRVIRYEKWDHKLETLLAKLKEAVEQQDRMMALGWMGAFGQVKEHIGQTKLAELILKWAEEKDNEQAVRICHVHLSQRTALSGEDNFLCQAIWVMAGGMNLVWDKSEPVVAGECSELIEKAKEAWKTPKPIPTWYCDGVYCAGNDTRFSGLVPEMYAVCRAYERYGRIDPSDLWLDSFRCLDGLVIEGPDSAGGR